MKRLYSSPNPIAWIFKMIVAGLIGGFVLRMSQLQSVTVHDFTIAFASIPMVVILAAELVDKISDRFDYINITAKLLYGVSINSKKIKEEQAVRATFISVILAGAVFFMTLYVIANTITLNLASYSPGTLLSAAIIALYVVAPETGDDELLLMLWLAANVATGFQYFTVLGSLGGIL
ncbi:MAG: hypothetical protein GXO35_03625 [Gammaproteobacteria bacterium]|nr:hypothetical protein [Gammaproteobacteria bacterium]